LPSGKTETGTWSFSAPATTAGGENYVPISFPIPLAAAGVGKAFFFTREQVELEQFGTSGCHWALENVNAKPEAGTGGTLCVFEQFGELEETTHFSQIPGEPAGVGYGPAGSFLIFIKKVTAEPVAVFGYGTWAVKAP
jgi:hypothetical protein